ncbi:hypothetical protein HDU85_005842 [Gaertneriomyces sp. JEL0708]|nr:hypothetical protein HDU85_005842 [Gaertneriomyces sp. JEL0708]
MGTIATAFRRHAQQIPVLCGETGEKLLDARNLKEAEYFASKVVTMISTLKGPTTRKLSDYSPTLAGFQPGQQKCMIPGLAYAYGAGAPTVTGFLPEVLVMSSLRQPTRITMQGSDGEEYPLLVSVGDDLRADQRIMRVFHTMKEILKKDLASAKFADLLSTYSVIPVTPGWGLVEWVKSTQTIKACLESESTYKNAYDAAKRRGLWGKALFESIPRNCLGSYLRLRREQDMAGIFTDSLAVNTICAYICGIGDRHLDNYLIDGTGKVTMINLSICFDAGMNLGQPEIVPFRFTRGLQEAVDRQRFQEGMITVMSSLCRNKAFIAESMSIMVDDPLLVWEGQARRRYPYLPAQQAAKQVSRDKISAAMEKLACVNPAVILTNHLDELVAHGYEGNLDLDKVREIVATRSAIGHTLSVEEQVDMLLDLATDPALLSKMYWGWNPWY